MIHLDRGNVSAEGNSSITDIAVTPAINAGKKKIIQAIKYENIQHKFLLGQCFLF